MKRIALFGFIALMVIALWSGPSMAARTVYTDDGTGLQPWNTAGDAGANLLPQPGFSSTLAGFAICLSNTDAAHGVSGFTDSTGGQVPAASANSSAFHMNATIGTTQIAPFTITVSFKVRYVSNDVEPFTGTGNEGVAGAFEPFMVQLNTAGGPFTLLTIDNSGPQPNNSGSIQTTVTGFTGFSGGANADHFVPGGAFGKGTGTLGVSSTIILPSAARNLIKAQDKGVLKLLILDDHITNEGGGTAVEEAAAACVDDISVVVSP